MPSDSGCSWIFHVTAILALRGLGTYRAKSSGPALLWVVTVDSGSAPAGRLCGIPDPGQIERGVAGLDLVPMTV